MSNRPAAGTGPAPVLPLLASFTNNFGEDRKTASFVDFLRENYRSFGLFLLLVFGLFFVLITVTVNQIVTPTVVHYQPPLPRTSAESDNQVHSVSALFEKPATGVAASAGGGDLKRHTADEVAVVNPPPPPPQQHHPKNYDTVFNFHQSTPLDSNTTSVRIFDIGYDLHDMDMVSVVFFTCCCNDKSIVVCDNRKTPVTSASSLASPFEDYSITCFLSHDPSAPALNTEHQQYQHHWKLVVEFGPAFMEAASHTECVFSTMYYTIWRPRPPPPAPPASELTKKIW